MNKFILEVGAMIFSIILSISAYAQSDYYLKISEAHGYYYTQGFDKAALLFEEAFTLDQPKSRDLIVAAYSTAEIKMVSQALEYLKQFFDLNSNVYVDIESIISYQAFDQLKLHPGWDEIIKEAERNNALLEPSLDLRLKKSLDSLYYLDQQTRDMSLIDSLVAAHGFPSDPVSEYLKKMNAQDKMNLNKFQELVPPGTWPGINQVGTRANLTAWLIIQHSSTAIQKKYLPALKKCVEAGDARWSHLAGTIDRIMVETEGIQLYGTQFGMDEEGNGFVKPIKDPANVDKRREKAGLIMLKHDVKRHGIEYGN